MKSAATTVPAVTAADIKFLQVLAHVLASQNREQMAADLLEFALSQDPSNAEIQKALCGVYLLLERFDDSIRAGERALADHATAGEAGRLKLVMSKAHHALGRHADAERLMAEYIQTRETT